jgi:predicted DNA-binding transcriptional regulator YafY
VTARLRFAPQWATIARDNRPYWESIEEQADGSIIVSFSAPDVKWAASAVLAYGGCAVVLEPEELRETVGEWARTIAEQHAVEREHHG